MQRWHSLQRALRLGLRWGFHALGATLSLALATATALLLVAVVGGALWTQSDASLDQALRLLSSVLPGGQSLQATGVAGSVKQGGHIDHLVWKQNQLTVELQDVDLAWDWQALLNDQLQLTRLHAKRVRVEDRNPPSGQPIAELPLPLQADVLFAIDELEWVGPPTVQLQQLQGRYRFDGSTHFLQDASVQMADGHYTGQAQLQAKSPMALALQVQGTVTTPVQIRQAPLTLVASATAKGTLFGPQALVELAAALQPEAAQAGKPRPLGAMQASLQAQLRPAQAQPIASAQAQWSALNLATLWPQAPQTSLSGQAQVQPDANGWKADIQLRNSAPGSLDQQRLPLNTANAQVLYRSGQWQLTALQAALAGGTLQAQGSYAGTPARDKGASGQWAVHGTLQGLEPAQVDTRWRFPALGGTFSAQQSAQGVVFDSQLSSTLRGGGTEQALQLQTKGSWKAHSLQLDSLQIQTPQATLTGQLQLDTQSYASSASLRANMPGAQLELDGKLSASSGQGSAAWHVKDAHALLPWLASLPLLGERLAALGAPGKLDGQGALELSARWSGGWQGLGENLQLQATLQSERLDLADKQLRDLQLDLNGSLHAFTTQLRGKAQIGATQFALQAQAHGGQQAADHWQLQWDALRLSASNALYNTPWTMELQQPVAMDWRPAALQQAFGLAAGGLRLSGPAPGAAQIQWQPVQWTHLGASTAAGSTRWSSKGQLQGLPLAWLELLGQTKLANLGLRGDLLFGGQWDASGGDALQLRASLQRTSGDLQLLASEQAGGSLPAGLRDAHVKLAVDNNALRAELVWASDAGGNAQADFATKLQTVNGVIAWPADAPLQAKVRANLPRVGAWSLIAPVGWRIQGTLDADAQLSGTRSNPAWKGNLEGHDMSVRSVVDGLDLSHGVMRLQVNGQHLEITELTLQGAGGASGGQLQISGSADWLVGPASEPVANRVRMALQAQASSFRVSAKPDQRLVVSGNLNAQLNNARLQVRGALKADQALFVLPDDTAPKLGADVVVIRKTPVGKAKTDAPAPPSPRLLQTVVPDISITLDPGSSFQLQGHGLNTRLAGQLTLKAEGLNATPKLVGELHTVSGTYRAYGQQLNIEEGTLRFNGPYDNPALDILALRPSSQQVVGVQISGTAHLPVVRLYSDPDLSDADKLSWLVLGRASSNGGAESAMLQQAALSLLAGKGKAAGGGGLFNAIGLDEVSMGQASTTNLDGTTGTEATVKLGKRLSRDFYVAYERTLSGTLGTFYMFYDLSRRFTLRGESGAQSAVDLIFTTRFD